ncbi:alpha/beta hydrolase [Ilumatobacter nonamiensis]|uniref:alpha/beta hydrolase n=1 Tax=Ilumatobacter nonamiensis TaxID=467093 RepID=UPI0011D1B91A|nr:alpha/beta hydrolase [Ilumatobacter nonamiensis]
MTVAVDLDSVLDEQHAGVVAMLPPDLLDLSDIPAARARLEGLLAMLPAPPPPENVTVSEASAPSLDGAPDVRLKIYTPDGLEPGAPAIYWIHGGGMVLMSADSDDLLCATRAANHGCVVVSVDYRLAPETPAPGLVDDCFAGLTWLAEHADELGVSADRIMIGGASAGGGLAAGTALRARDEGGPALVGQLLVFPMLDHRNDTASSEAIQDLRVWNRSANQAAWAAYLGDEEPSAYSSPALADDLGGLPPAYINVGTFDMFLDEDIAYAMELNRAGVACELHVYPGAFHGSNGFLPDHPTSVRWRDDEDAFIARTLHSAAT